MKFKLILPLVLSFSIVGAYAQDTLSVLFLGNS
jgi:hypothetical protein